MRISGVPIKKNKAVSLSTNVKYVFLFFAVILSVIVSGCGSSFGNVNPTTITIDDFSDISLDTCQDGDCDPDYDYDMLSAICNDIGDHVSGGRVEGGGDWQSTSCCNRIRKVHISISYGISGLSDVSKSDFKISHDVEADDVTDFISDATFVVKSRVFCDQDLPMNGNFNAYHPDSYCNPDKRVANFICVPQVKWDKKSESNWIGRSWNYRYPYATEWVAVPPDHDISISIDAGSHSDNTDVSFSDPATSCSGNRGPRVSFEDGHQPECEDGYFPDECDLSGVDDDCDGNIDERVIPYDYAVFTDEGTCQTGEKYIGTGNATHSFGDYSRYGGNCNPYDVNEEDYLYEGAGSRKHFDLSSVGRDDYDYNRDDTEDGDDELYAFAEQPDCLPEHENRLKTPPIYPQRERYDGLDNDCDGAVDEASDVDIDSYCNENMYIEYIPNSKVVCSNANAGDLSYLDFPASCTSLSGCGDAFFSAYCADYGYTFSQQTVDNRVSNYRTTYGENKIVCENSTANTTDIIDAPSLDSSFLESYCPGTYSFDSLEESSFTCEKSTGGTSTVSLVTVLDDYCNTTTPGNNSLKYQTKWETHLSAYFFRNFPVDNIVCSDGSGNNYTLEYSCPSGGCVQETYVDAYLDNLVCNETQKFVGQTQSSNYTSYVDTSQLTCPSTTDQGTDPADYIGAIDGTLNYDSCDGLDNDQDGLVDEGDGDSDFAACTYSTNLLYYNEDDNGKFYACTDDPVKFTEITEHVTSDTSLGTNALEQRDTPNVKAYNDTCDIVGSYYCAADDHWKSTYRFNSVLAAGYGGDIVSRVRTTPDGTQNYCCPPDWCAWNATLNCVENLTYSYANAGWFDPDTVSQVRCSKGEWNPSIKKYDWYHDQFGYCHDPYTQCYADEDTFVTDPRLGSYADTLGTTQCFDSGEFYENHYCEEGNWSTRTKQIAMKLMHFADENMLTSYALSCGNSSLVLNEDPSSYTWMTTCMDGSCANEFCVLRYDDDDDERVVLGTSLNILPNETLPTSGTSFLEELDVSQYYCDNVLAKDRENLLNNKYFVCSGDKSIFYNPVTQSMLFTNDPLDDMGEYTSAWNQMVAMVSHPLHSLSVLFGSIASVFSSTDDVLSEARENDLAVLGNVSDFTQLYLSRSGSQNVYGLMEMKAGADGSIYSSYAVSYEGFSFDLCSYVETYNENIDPSHTVRDIDCFNQTDEKQTLYYRSNSFMLWSDLTQKMRLDE